MVFMQMGNKRRKKNQTLTMSRVTTYYNTMNKIYSKWKLSIGIIKMRLEWEE